MKTKILLIDDDPDFSEASKITLEQAGYKVILAQTGKQGLNSVRKEKPDLIILDVMLPDLNGFSICRELKDDPNFASIPIVLLTAISADSESYAENIAKEHKADAYLSKPVDKKKMLQIVNSQIIRIKPVPKHKETKAKILLVDDDPDFLEATKQILVANKYQVITAKNGIEGITKARSENPDLIVLDVIMPGKDGYTVCYELRKSNPTRSVPIIMLTAIGQQFSKPEYGIDIAIDHLADDFIDKPVDASTLLRRIEKHLLFR